MIHLSDVKAPKGVTFVALSHGSDLPLASIHKAKGASSDTAEDGTEEGEANGAE